MMKVKVEQYADSGKPDFDHLSVVVKYLLEQGNESCSDFVWGNNRTGYFCHFKKSIDFVDLLDKFDFPDTVKITPENQTIDCFNTYAVIKGGMG